MTKNFVFREFHCGLSIEQTAELCFKSVSTVKGWDYGKTIPHECKRLMRLATKFELHHTEEWRGFRMVGDKMELPTGQIITPQEILTGLALLEIKSELELRTTTKLLKYVRCISAIDRLRS